MTTTTATRPRRTALGLALVAVLVTAAPAAAQAARAAGEPPPHATGSIEVLIGSGFVHLVDEPPSARQPFDVSAGDVLLFHDPVLDPDDPAQQIGTAVTRVHVVEPLDGGDAVFLLDCTVRLPDGTLVFSGAEQLAHLGIGVTYAVTGGTGRYAGARGTVDGEMDETDGEEVSRLTFSFTQP